MNSLNIDNEKGKDKKLTFILFTLFAIIGKNIIKASTKTFEYCLNVVNFQKKKVIHEVQSEVVKIDRGPVRRNWMFEYFSTDLTAVSFMFYMSILPEEVDYFLYFFGENNLEKVSYQVVDFFKRQLYEVSNIEKAIYSTKLHYVNCGIDVTIFYLEKRFEKYNILS